MKIAKRFFFKVVLVVGALLVTVYISSGDSIEKKNNVSGDTQTQLKKLEVTEEQDAKKVDVTSDAAKKENDINIQELSKSKESIVKEITKGLTYTIDKEGSDLVVAKFGKKVSVHYTGWLKDGGSKDKPFDSSKTRGVPFEFPLGAGYVIKGWDMGVEGMKQGEIRTLTIAPEFGYGARGIPGAIPAHATLIFEVEFLGQK